MATGNVTVTTAAAFIPEIWLPEIMLALRTALKFRGIARIIEGKGKSLGDKVHIPKLNFLAARDKAANTEITFDVSTDTDVYIDINKHKYHALVVEDIVKVQSDYQQLQARAQQVTYPVAKAMDTDLAGLYSGITAVVDGGALSTTTAVAKLVELKRTLDEADAPDDGRVLAIEPYTESILIQTDKFTSRDYIASGAAPLVEGAIGRIMGFDLVRSNNIQTSGGKYQNVAFIKEFTFGLALGRDLEVDSWREDRHRGDALYADAIYGVKALEADSGCKFTVTVPAE